MERFAKKGLTQTLQTLWYPLSGGIHPESSSSLLSGSLILIKSFGLHLSQLFSLYL